MQTQYNLKEMKIEVTYQCPLVCVHCSSDAHPDNLLQMDIAVCENIIKQAYELGLKKLSFSGGEPLIWPHIFDVIKYANELGIETTVYTCGNIENQAETFSKLKENGLAKAVFSVYSANPAEHEKITRIRGSYANTIAAISCCNDIGIETEIHFVATAHNYIEFPKLCDLSRKIKTSSISILRFVPQGRGKLFENSIMSKEQNLELINMIKRMKQQGHNIRTGSPMNVFYLNQNPECLAGIDRLIISPDLKIYPCDAFKQVPAESVVGNIQNSTVENNTLAECWEFSPYLCKIRNTLNGAPIDRCATCSNLSKCNTGCLAQKFLKYGKLDRGPDPACLMK